MVKMVREQIKKLILSLEKYDKKKLRRYLIIAMVAIMVIIAIILVNIQLKNKDGINENFVNNGQNVEVVINDNESINSLIKDYFVARTNLNYAKIFSSFGRDYYKEERESKDGSFKSIIDGIRYEKMFVKSYDNIKIYTCDGFRDNEKVCITTYDMSLGFTSDAAPMIIIFYVAQVDDKYIIKGDLDIGTSKYLIDVARNKSVKSIYDEVYNRLNRILMINESLRLSYNSLRQYEMNKSFDIGPINKIEIIESIGVKGLDPINDAKYIYDTIANEKKEQRKKDDLNKYLEKVIASLSDAQRAN